MGSIDKKTMAYMMQHCIFDEKKGKKLCMTDSKIAEENILREEIENIKNYRKGFISSKIDDNEKKDMIEELNKIYRKHCLDFIIDEKGNLLLKDKDKVISNFFIYPKAIINEYNEFNVFKRKMYLQICFSRSKKTLYLLIDEERLENYEWIKVYLKNFKYDFNFKLYNKFKDLIRFSSNNKKKLKVIDFYNTTGIVKTFDKRLEYRSKYSVGYGHTHSTLIKSYRDILDFIEVAPDDVTMPLLCYTILGALKSILELCSLEPNFVLLISCEDVRKIRSLTYPFSGILHFDEEIPKNGDLRASNTDNIEVVRAKASKYKDSVLVIDYYEAENIKELEESFLNNYYDIKKYNEMSRNNNCYALNRLPVLLYKKSLEKPLYYNIKVENDINLKDNMQKFYDEDIISDSIFNFIEEFIKYFNSDEKGMISKIRGIFKDERKKLLFVNNIQERRVEIFSWFMIALKLFIAYGKSINAISSDEGNEIIERQRNIFKNKLLDKQVVKIEKKEDIQVDIFMNSLKDIFENRRDMIPEFNIRNFSEEPNTKYVGWSKQHTFEDKGKEEKRKVECILLNEQSFKNLNNILNSNKTINTKYEEVLGILDNKGLIEIKDSDRRNEKSIKLKGVNHRFLVITLEKLYSY